MVSYRIVSNRIICHVICHVSCVVSTEFSVSCEGGSGNSWRVAGGRAPDFALPLVALFCSRDLGR